MMSGLHAALPKAHLVTDWFIEGQLKIWGRALTANGLQDYLSHRVASLTKKVSWPKLFMVVALLGVAGVSLFAFEDEPRFIPVAGEGSLSLPIGDLKSGDVKFFSYRDQAGRRIRFLLARDSNGRIHAAFDACKRCYTYHRGYTASNGELICKFCGNRYKLEAMESGLASCVPIKLPVHAVGPVARVKVAELERGRQLF